MLQITFLGLWGNLLNVQPTKKFLLGQFTLWCNELSGLLRLTNLEEWLFKISTISIILKNFIIGSDSKCT